MASDAKSGGGQFAWTHLRMLRQSVEDGAAVTVEFGYGGIGCVLQSPRSPAVVKAQGGSRSLDSVVNLGGNYHEAIACQTHAGAQHRRRELKDVGIKDYSGIFGFAFGSWRGHKHAQRRTIDSN